MADLSPGIGFVAVTPCRIVDTRGGGVFSGAYGPPALIGNAAARPFDINSAPHCPGIPAGAEAYSLNFTLIAAAGSFQNAFLTAWPTGGAQPVVSTLNFNAGQLVANAAIVPAGTNGSISVFVIAPGHLLIDINGYFTDEYNPGVSLEASSATVAPAILGENTSSADAAVAIKGVIISTTPGISAAAIRGINNSTAGTNIGGMGVYGSHAGHGWGVLGESAHRYGVLGRAFGTEDNNIGVNGHASGTSGKTYGVRGQTDSSTRGSAGVLGVGEGRPAFTSVNFNPGVLGEGFVGVTGIGYSLGAGVYGILVEDNVNKAAGYLGTNRSPGFTDYGVYSEGPYGGTGAKYFVEPHPNDPSKVIRYVSLEGNESGTYFRGRARFQNGLARISVPEDFRLVSDPDGLTVQVTPIGELATVAVLRMDLIEIVVKSSRNVEFSYTVNGIRKTHKHLTPIGPGREYMPETPHAKMPLWLTEGQKQMLISNGTYREDGTVNMETARRLGWDKEWDKRARPAPQPPD